MNGLPPRLPTKEEWEGWLAQPTTQVLRALAHIKKMDIQECWGSGGFSLDTVEKNALKSAEKIGEVSVWAFLLELNYQKLINEIGDEYGEYLGARTRWQSGPGSDV